MRPFRAPPFETRSTGAPQGEGRLSNDVRQQTEEARTLDCLRQFALFFGRHRGDAARHDLATFGNVTLQQLHVFVVDLGRVGAGERAGLAPAKERPARSAATTATATALG